MARNLSNSMRKVAVKVAIAVHHMSTISGHLVAKSQARGEWSTMTTSGSGVNVHTFQFQ